MQQINLATAQLVLDGTDDKTFCEELIAVAQQSTDEGVSLIFEAWALERLKLIRRRNERIFLGTFLPLLKRAFPGQVNPRDLLVAMQSVTGEASLIAGDYTPELWEAAIEDILHHGPPKGYPTGWKNLDHYYTVRLGQVTVITGIPSHMKSTWVQGLCLHMAEQYDWTISLYTPEHYPLGDLGTMLIESYTQQSHKMLDPQEQRHAKKWITTHFRPIMAQDEIQPTVSWILAVARKQKERYGALHGLVIDPWNRLEHAYGEHETGEKYLAAALSQITRFAQYHQVHVWIVAHPKNPRPEEKAKSGDYEGHYPPRSPYDISGGAHFYNMADACVSIWRDAIHNSPEIEVHVQKVRNRHVGRVGMVHLRHDGYRFQEVPEPATDQWIETGEYERAY